MFAKIITAQILSSALNNNILEKQNISFQYKKSDKMTMTNVHFSLQTNHLAYINCSLKYQVSVIIPADCQSEW